MTTIFRTVFASVCLLVSLAASAQSAEEYGRLEREAVAAYQKSTNPDEKLILRNKAEFYQSQRIALEKRSINAPSGYPVQKSQLVPQPQPTLPPAQLMPKSKDIVRTQEGGGACSEVRDASDLAKCWKQHCANVNTADRSESQRCIDHGASPGQGH